ncbi:MAG: hypothetical protein WD042_17935 [Phycisphaeraceae bacterium]
MSFFELTGLYFDRSNALQWYWTLYVLIIGGLLAFSALRSRPDLITTLLVSILFASFAYKNMGAIVETTLQRLAILDTMTQLADGGAAEVNAVSDRLLPTLKPVLPDPIRRFHIMCDVLTIGAIWAMELRRRRKFGADVVVTMK